jgi:hypothetical protein
MTRKEFILISIHKSARIAKIILYFSVIIYLLLFLKNSFFDKNSTERQISILFLILFGLLCLSWLAKSFFSSIWDSFSEKLKSNLNTISKFSEYLSILFLIYFAYLNWEENKLMVFIFSVLFIFSYSNKLLKQTKQT